MCWAFKYLTTLYRGPSSTDGILSAFRRYVLKLIGSIPLTCENEVKSNASLDFNRIYFIYVIIFTIIVNVVWCKQSIFIWSVPLNYLNLLIYVGPTVLISWTTKTNWKYLVEWNSNFFFHFTASPSEFLRRRAKQIPQSNAYRWPVFNSRWPPLTQSEVLQRSQRIVVVIPLMWRR